MKRKTDYGLGFELCLTNDLNHKEGAEATKTTISNRNVYI